MKCEVEFKLVKQALKSIASLRSLGKDSDADNVCLLTVVEADSLSIEATHMGAYLEIKVPCKTLRPGSVGVNASMLGKCRFSTATLINAEKGTLLVSAKKGKTKYNIQPEQNVAQLMEDSRPDATKASPVAKIPFSLWKQGASTIAFQTGLKDKEPLEIQIGIKKGTSSHLEMAGIDNYGVAYFRRESEDLKAKEDCEFVIQSTLLSRVVTSLPEAKHVVMGLIKRKSVPTAVRFKSKEFDFYHPTIDKTYQNVSEKVGWITSGDLDVRFQTSKDKLVSSLKDVLALGKSSDRAVIELAVGKGVVMSASVDGNNSDSLVEDAEVEAPGKILVFDNYLDSFLKAIPQAEVSVEQWRGAFVKMDVLNMSSGEIGFVVSRPV